MKIEHIAMYVNDLEKAKEFFVKYFGAVSNEMCIRDRDMTAVRHVLIQNPCCRRAYIRGAFLASGSVSDPEKGYHFEIVCADSARAEQLSAMLESFGIEAKITLRKHSYICLLYTSRCV